MRSRPYVGIRAGSGKYEVFRSATTPTENQYPQYNAAIGPFKTRRGAAFMAQYGPNNPHCITVNDAERLART